MVAMIFVSLAVSWTPAEGTWPLQVSVPLINYIFTHHKRTDTGLVHIMVCPFTPQLGWYSLTDPGGMVHWVDVAQQPWVRFEPRPRVHKSSAVTHGHREVSSLIEELCKLLPLLIDFIILSRRPSSSQAVRGLGFQEICSSTCTRAWAAPAGGRQRGGLM